MKKRENKRNNNLVKTIIVSIVILFLFILFNNLLGICYIHEYGHYILGKSFGCKDIRIECEKAFTLDKIDGVAGWSSCGVIKDISGKVCDIKSYTALIGGFLATLIVYTIILVIISLLLNKFISVDKKGVFLITFIGVIAESSRTAAFDFSNILSCLIYDVSLNTWKYVFLLLPYLGFIVFLVLWYFYKKSE